MKHQAPQSQISDSKYLRFLTGAISVISALCLWVIFTENHTVFEKWFIGLTSALMIIILINSYFSSKEKVNL